MNHLVNEHHKNDVLSTEMIKDIASSEEHQAKVILLFDNLTLKFH